MGAMMQPHRVCGTTYDAEGRCDCPDRVIEMARCLVCGEHYPAHDVHVCPRPVALLATRRAEEE